VSEQLLVGQAVELHIEGSVPPVKLVGVVAAIPPREILLSLPSGVVEPPALLPGVSVTVSFATSLGLHQARTTVLRVSPGRAVGVAVARLSEVTTSQRRQFFRVSASLATLLVVGPSQSSSLGKEDARAITQDLSAGGMRVDTVLPLAINDQLRVTVHTPRGLRRHLPDTLVCEARVVRVEQVVRRNRKLCSAGLQFMFQTESERDRWVQLTFDLQRGVQI
jgi:c-di-GMP-binding flagellar brake protein YcgR